MALDQTDVESTILANGYRKSESNSKRIQYDSITTANTIYFIPGVGLPRMARIVVHPGLNIATLLKIDGITLSEKGLHHGSTLSAFPKKMHTGKDEIHYGQALNAENIHALANMAKAIHHL